MRFMYQKFRVFFQCKSMKFHWKLHVTRADTSARIRVFRKKWRLKTIGKKLLQLVKASFRWILRCPRVQRRETSNFAYFHKNSARGLKFRYKEVTKKKMKKGKELGSQGISPGAPPAPVRLPGQKNFWRKILALSVDWTVEVRNKRWKFAAFL